MESEKLARSSLKLAKETIRRNKIIGEIVKKIPLTLITSNTWMDVIATCVHPGISSKRKKKSRTCLYLRALQIL